MKCVLRSNGSCEIRRLCCLFPIQHRTMNFGGQWNYFFFVYRYLQGNRSDDKRLAIDVILTAYSDTWILIVVNNYVVAYNVSSSGFSYFFVGKGVQGIR